MAAEHGGPYAGEEIGFNYYGRELIRMASEGQRH